jgi:hypothetical protein
MEGEDITEQCDGFSAATEAVEGKGGEQSVVRVPALLEILLEYQKVRQRCGEVVDLRVLTNPLFRERQQSTEQGQRFFPATKFAE